MSPVTTDSRQREQVFARCRLFLERARAGTRTPNAIEAILGYTVADHDRQTPFRSGHCCRGDSRVSSRVGGRFSNKRITRGFGRILAPARTR